MKAKQDGYSKEIGVAWVVETGQGVRGLSVQLNPGTVLSFRDCQDHFIGIWPIEPTRTTLDVDGPALPEDNLPF